MVFSSLKRRREEDIAACLFARFLSESGQAAFKRSSFPREGKEAGQANNRKLRQDGGKASRLEYRVCMLKALKSDVCLRSEGKIWPRGEQLERANFHLLLQTFF